MPEAATDHRRAIAERNVEAILDAAEALLERRASASIAAVATEAGVSRVTVYAHFPTREALLEAVVARLVDRAGVVLDAAEPDRGPALEALDRVLTAGWRELYRNSAIAAQVQLEPDAHRRSHDAAMRRVRRLVDRGRKEGAFRTDLPAEWLVTSLFALMHACGDDVRAGTIDADSALEVLLPTVRSVFAGPATPTGEGGGAPSRRRRG